MVAECGLQWTHPDHAKPRVDHSLSLREKESEVNLLSPSLPFRQRGQVERLSDDRVSCMRAIGRR